MKITPEEIEKWITLGFTIAGGVPGAIAGIVGFIQQWAPTEIAQEWTEAKVSAYIANYDFEQKRIKDQFDTRRTTEG